MLCGRKLWWSMQGKLLMEEREIDGVPFVFSATWFLFVSMNHRPLAFFFRLRGFIACHLLDMLTLSWHYLRSSAEISLLDVAWTPLNVCDAVHINPKDHRLHCLRSLNTEICEEMLLWLYKFQHFVKLKQRWRRSWYHASQRSEHCVGGLPAEKHYRIPVFPFKSTAHQCSAH